MEAIENEFLRKKATIDGLLLELQAHSEDFFGVIPDNITWGHIGDLNRIIELLTEIKEVN